MFILHAVDAVTCSSNYELYELYNMSYICPATLQRIKRRTYNVQIMDGWMDELHLIKVKLCVIEETV